jgi:hypothetical protein
MSKPVDYPYIQNAVVHTLYIILQNVFKQNNLNLKIQYFLFLLAK